MDKFSYLGTSDLATIEKMYQDYLTNPENVEKSWRTFFEGFEFAVKNYSDKIQKNATKSSSEDKSFYNKEFRVVNLIQAYRQRGHLFTKTNPVRKRRNYFPTLSPANFGLEKDDLNQKFQAGIKIGIGEATLKEIIQHLEMTYCDSIGVEYVYIRHPEVIEWLQNKMEKARNQPNYNKTQKWDLYDHLVKAVGFEAFIHKKFVGQKRFSLEGAETLIPALEAVINRGAELGIEEFVIGMPHRGRLNVLANILQKPYEEIFAEFVGKKFDPTISLGDVKYHLGYDNNVNTPFDKIVSLHLAPNPSHLETVGAVIQGITKAKIITKYKNDVTKVAPISIHGDAAIAGQGIVYETIQMSQLEGYGTGGTIHLVINNQVGFTTDYLDARSSTYCTDIAKVTRSPVFHVNGDDVEALAYTIQLAMEFRQKFNNDVFIDILCYRKHGHNEGDEPRFTQPKLYKAIANHKNPRDIYIENLINNKTFTNEEVQKEINDFDNLLEEKFEISKKIENIKIKLFLEEYWKSYRYPENKDFLISNETGFDNQNIKDLALKLNTLPANKKFFRKIEKLMKERQKLIQNNKIDWALGEQLAYATLLVENYPVRLSGQDSERGTFSHRHATFILPDSNEKYTPLQNITENQAKFSVYNSPLNEYGVMGFEYGYALASPEGLTIWEAQFGDFYNVAQAVIDQYISSAEEKWGLKNGLVLFLPHGFEGQGPEHSSARIERFLNLAANNNMQIVNCTTPANLFHVLRRQIKRDFRVPLVVFTPKSLLRHPKCISEVNDLQKGSFKEVIDDNNVEPEKVSRIVFCSGKIYYDLLERKEQFNATDLALVRIEQLYPFPQRQLSQIVRKYPNNMLSIWVQEEPENMGAWSYINANFKNIQLEPVTRKASGSPAVGLNFLHVMEQADIIGKIFRKCDCELNNIYCGLQCVEGKSRKEILKQHRYIFE